MASPSRLWRSPLAPCLASTLMVACLEPNPNADAGTGGTDTSGTATTDTTTTADTSESTSDTGSACDPCELGFESISFEAGSEGFTGSVPKPDQPHTVPIAVVQDYAPGNVDTLGYAITWTDLGESWEVQVEVTGAGNNSTVAGVAAVLGFATEPVVEEVEVTGADVCGEATLGSLGDRVVVDAVERYEPGDDAEFSYERMALAEGVEYCILAPDVPEASLRFKAVAFDVPEGVSALEIPALTLDSAAPQSADYAELGPTFEVLHLIGAQTFVEVDANNLGYGIACGPASPYGCSYDLSGFKAGARVVAGGVIVGIQ